MECGKSKTEKYWQFFKEIVDAIGGELVREIPGFRLVGGVDENGMRIQLFSPMGEGKIPKLPDALVEGLKDVEQSAKIQISLGLDLKKLLSDEKTPLI